MSVTSFKVSFTLDEGDVDYFRRLFRNARKSAAGSDPDEIITAAAELVKTVRSKKGTPRFVVEAIAAIEDLTEIILDEDYHAPKPIRNQVLGALAYFANPDDLIPDEIPVFGFLDDAIMIKFVEDEFRHELWAYRKFRKYRDGAEQRPWTKIASSRLPGRLDAYRKKLRAEVALRKARDEAKGRVGF
ncbi:MAG: DUF1232 domain-containing protein [Myxococcales bacterium]|nr:DUF1232 domain-containing protein [Myxococcales bacterium]